MKLTNEQIEKILNKAPEGADEFFIHLGAANYIDNRENGHQFKIWDEDESCWVYSELIDGWQYIRGRRSLNDLREILHLRKEVERLHLENQQLRSAIDDVNELMHKSRGVAGLNNFVEFVEWSELQRGGNYDCWLGNFSDVSERFLE